MKQAKGFTLIEVMIVVALLAIVAAIAIPAYGDYVIRGKLVEASTQLADLRIKLEQSYQDNRNYTSLVDANCNYTSGSSTGTPATAAHKYFTYACATTANPDTYLLTATGNANQGIGAIGDYTYTIDQNNNKVTVKFAGQTVNATCWLMKKNDSC
jgi:type IV pilus assembly protein PilE